MSILALIIVLIDIHLGEYIVGQLLSGYNNFLLILSNISYPINFFHIIIVYAYIIHTSCPTIFPLFSILIFSIIFLSICSLNNSISYLSLQVSYPVGIHFYFYFYTIQIIHHNEFLSNDCFHMFSILLRLLLYIHIDAYIFINIYAHILTFYYIYLSNIFYFVLYFIKNKLFLFYVFNFCIGIILLFIFKINMVDINQDDNLVCINDHMVKNERNCMNKKNLF